MNHREFCEFREEWLTKAIRFRETCEATMNEIRAHAKYESDSIRLRLREKRERYDRESRKINLQIEELEQALKAKREEFAKIQRQFVDWSNRMKNSVPRPLIEACFESNKVPMESGIYFVFERSESERPLYVGRAKCLRKRASLTKRGKNRSDGKILVGEWLSWIVFDTNEDLIYEESLFIGICRPVRNKETPVMPKRARRLAR